MQLIGLFLIAMAAFLPGCAASKDTAGGAGEPAGHVTSGELGDKWPLTVDSGELRCDGSAGSGEVVFTAPNGTEYGLNGTALGGGYADPEPIWRFEPGLEKYELRVSMGPLLSRGLALCG